LRRRERDLQKTENVLRKSTNADSQISRLIELIGDLLTRVEHMSGIDITYPQIAISRMTDNAHSVNEYVRTLTENRVFIFFLIDSSRGIVGDCEQ
jgi:hypothetical protein